jgi:hypothetical protein
MVSIRSGGCRGGDSGSGGRGGSGGVRRGVVWRSGSSGGTGISGCIGIIVIIGTAIISRHSSSSSSIIILIIILLIIVSLINLIFDSNIIPPLAYNIPRDVTVIIGVDSIVSDMTMKIEMISLWTTTYDKVRSVDVYYVLQYLRS